MKNKRLYNIGMAAAIVVPLLFSSCSDSFLDVTPPDKATVDEYYTTAPHIYEALTAAYNPMRIYDWNGTQYAPLNLCSDVMADDILAGGSGISDNQYLHKMANYSSTENSSDALTGIWDNSFNGVRDCNDVITYCANNAGKLDAATLKEYDAEARVLRAFYYCQLWKFYGNIPFYMSNLSEPYAANQTAPDDVYKNVITDLETVIDENILPLQWDNNNLGRWSQAAAYMLYAEMVMYQNDETRYSKALGYMQAIIKSGKFSLTPNYADIWKESGEWNSESIFEINYSDDKGARSWSWVHGAGGTVYPRLIGPSDWQGGLGIDRGWGFGTVRTECYNMFNANDTRRGATCFDARNAKYTKRYEDTGFFQDKYIPMTANNKDQIADADLNFNNNLRIYRYAETLLNAAELLLRTNGSTSDAQVYLNMVHHRAGLTDNVAATIDNIINERHLEFVGEGKRYWDLIRTGKAAATLVPDTEGWRTNSWTESKKYLPIPLSEIDRAQNTLIQNKY